MACNSCTKPYTLFRKEKGCPSCGFSFCSKCLNQTIFVTKLNTNAKVCLKCSKSTKEIQQGHLEPPDAYYKLKGLSENENKVNANRTDQEIKQRLQSLKDMKHKPNNESEDVIRERLKNLKGPQPSTSDTELESRLANLRGVPVNNVQNKQIFITPDLRTEQEQADDLLKCYLEQADIDKKYKKRFDENIDDIETRIQKLKGMPTDRSTTQGDPNIQSEDEETEIMKLVEKVHQPPSTSIKMRYEVKAETLLDIPQSSVEELPFCEICNEEAKMRCLGCQYLFCKRCFMEHRDDDDGCNEYEPYKQTRIT